MQFSFSFCKGHCKPSHQGHFMVEKNMLWTRILHREVMVFDLDISSRNLVRGHNIPTTQGHRLSEVGMGR